MFELGDKVWWRSQSGGYKRRKEGTVIAVGDVDQKLRQAYGIVQRHHEKHVHDRPFAFGRIKFDPVYGNTLLPLRRGSYRVIIAVPRPGDGVGFNYYAPRIRWLKPQK